ncbi:uncharacterized protein LOC124416041 [Diprion similis]|uniref:uncharacterized protein LOC124416041 n=1 Tax=Diprion similis TaxID=362088 RepID=UPI001EF79D7E|nr:uncharacterized protein LOC124416041 [Diprion similis]
MKLQAGILLVVVFIGSPKVTEGKPYVTELWRKGVATVRNLVLGPVPAPWHQEAVWQIEFDPDAGVRKAPDYQRYFGQRGEGLVQLLGSGNYRPGNNQMSPRSINARMA